MEGKSASKKIDALLVGFWRENWPETPFSESLPSDYVKQVLRDMVAAVERSLGKCSVTITETSWEQCEEDRSRLPSLGKLRDEVTKLQAKAGKPTGSAEPPPVASLEAQPSNDSKLPETVAANDAQQPLPESELPRNSCGKRRPAASSRKRASSNSCGKRRPAASSRNRASSNSCGKRRPAASSRNRASRNSCGQTTPSSLFQKPSFQKQLRQTTPSSLFQRPSFQKQLRQRMPSSPCWRRKQSQKQCQRLARQQRRQFQGRRRL